MSFPSVSLSEEGVKNAKKLNELAHLRTFLGPITFTTHRGNVVLRQAVSSTTTPYEIHHSPGGQQSSNGSLFFIVDVAVVLCPLPCVK